jgi:hypothetical protein
MAPPSARLSDDEPEARHATKAQSVRLTPREVGVWRLENDSLKKSRNPEMGRTSWPAGVMDELEWLRGSGGEFARPIGRELKSKMRPSMADKRLRSQNVRISFPLFANSKVPRANRQQQHFLVRK